MGATSSSRPEDAATANHSATADHSAEPADPPTRQIVAAAGVGDRCAACGAVLASDQRYCVNCGERRGKARFSLANQAPAVVEESTAVTSARRPRLSSGVTLVLGVGVLLLAMLVGVLIGHNNSPRQTAAAPPAQIVTVGGGSGAAATPAAGAGAGSSAPTKISAAAQKARKHVPAKKVVITKQVAAKADAAANKVFGGATNLAPPTVQQGGSCSNGQAGCQNGQFTGNFFGGG